MILSSGTVILALLSTGLCSSLPPGIFGVPLDGRGLHNLYWQLNYEARIVAMEVHFNVPPGAWLAVGFSDFGTITDADLCLLWTDWKGKVHFQDTWTDEDGVVHVDEQQDCEHLGLDRVKNIVKLVFRRQFDTCDENDYIIEEGTTHVVWATGRGPLFRAEGLDVTSAQSGFQRTQLLKNLHSEVPMSKDTWSFAVTEDNNPVPSIETTYWCRVVRLPEQLRRKHHIVKSEAVVMKGNEPLVHHMELFHCETATQQEIPLYRGPCNAPDRPPETQVCKKVMAAWAMGATPFYYPQEAGLPAGGSDYNMFAMLEIHYNNPELKDDWVDSSGMRVYITESLRPYDAAVMELGLEYIDKMAIPPRQPGFQLSGYCVSECTGVALPQHGITVFGSQLHTHLTGWRVMTQHIRDGRELPLLNWDNHYSTHFQEIRLLKRPVQVLPGDALITTCTYDTRDRPNMTLGGFAITDEMCVNYIYYYPPTDLEVCKSSISDQSLQTYFRQLHEWEWQSTSPQLGVSDNYRSIQWTPVRVDVLSRLYTEAPIYMQCNQSSGERFPGDWTSLPVSPVLYPLPPPPRDCP